MPTNIRNHPRFAQALWYAYGQQDAGIGVNVEAFDFALAHATLAVQVDNGRANHIASIQDDWKNFLGLATEVTIRNIAPIADEVREFLAKSIDEAQS